MSAHLPECRYYPQQSIAGDVCCICPALRACEARVRSAELAEAKALLASRDEAWESGVQAARDAVAAASLRIPYDDRRHVNLADAFAAIDALKGEQA